HAVAAGVVQHGALEGDDPRAARGQGDVRVDRVLLVEVDEAGLHRLQLRVLVEVEQVGEVGADAGVFGGRGLDGGNQVGVAGSESQHGGVVESGGAARTLVGAERGELVEQRHGRSS